MTQSMRRQIEELGGVSAAELREKYREVFGEETSSRHKGFLRKRVFWRLQANAEGGLSERARRRAAELADEADLRLLTASAQKVAGRCAPSRDRRLPMPGTVLMREYRKSAGGNGVPGIATELAELQNQIGAAEQRLAEINGEAEALGAGDLKERDVIRALETIDSRWETLSPREQARIVQLLMDRAAYDGGEETVAITFRSVGIRTLGSEGEGMKPSDAVIARGATVEFKVHFRRGDRGRRRLRQGQRKRAPAGEPGHVPRISRLLALAIHFEGLVHRREVRDHADLARLGGVTRARIPQIMALLDLAPMIQEEVLFLPRTTGGRDVVTERQLRPIASTPEWWRQRAMWAKLKVGAFIEPTIQGDGIDPLPESGRSQRLSRRLRRQGSADW